MSRTALDVTLAYHQRSKHLPFRFAVSLGYMDWETQPDPFRRFEGAPTLPLELEPVGAEPGYETALVLGDVDPAPLSKATVSRLFHDALALSAWKEIPGTRWSLRVNPSSGNLHPTEGYLISGPIAGLHDRPGVYHYAPFVHALEQRAELSRETWALLAAQLPDHSLLVGLSSIYWRESWKYGERAFRYCHHDAGHAIACIAIAAAGLGWEARLLPGVVDEQLDLLLGVHLQSGIEAEHADWHCQLEPILARLDARPRKKTPEYCGFPSRGSRVLPQMSLKLTIPADRFAAEYKRLEPEPDRKPEPLSLGQLFDIYRCEVTPTKGDRSQKHDRTASTMFLEFLGRGRDPRTLSKRDWERFIRERRAGQVGPSGKLVANRTIERDLRFLLAVLSWAAQSRDEAGELLIPFNPLKGLQPPVERNPTRVVLNDEEYRALLEVSLEVDWRFHVALVLAHETGHRIGAIRSLRWSDVDLEGGRVRWRADHEKTGVEHELPVTPEALAALQLARERNPGIGESPVLPAPKDSARPVSRNLVRDWWPKAEALAGIEPVVGRGWHSLRRKFASDLMDQPMKVLCQRGGWKTARTVLECYQQADQAKLKEALAARRRA